jgi:TRAP-type transport system small permease protein
MRKVSGRVLLVWIAGGALLVAMLVDTLAMLGRQVRWPLLGAIEIVQAAVLIGACGALLVAARERAHARVHLLLERVGLRTHALLTRLHDIAAAVFYIALLAGSAWIALDLWQGQEESELLRLPYRPLRIITVLTLATLSLMALRSALRRGTQR